MVAQLLGGVGRLDAFGCVRVGRRDCAGGDLFGFGESGMVQPLSKLANPWKCDAPGCGQLRANDTNHWLLIAFLSVTADGAAAPAPGPDVFPRVIIQPWNDRQAEAVNAKHACGIDCGTRIAAMLIVKHFSPA